MESFNTLKKESDIIDQINKNFNIQNIVIGTLNFGNKIPIIFIKFKSISDLEINWKEFNSFITAEYLLKMENEFSKWNSYLFYLAEKPIPKSLKYEIENNKFSTRKAIVESDSHEINSEVIDQIISEFIIINNINFKVERKEIESFAKNVFIDEALEQALAKSLITLKEENLLEILNNLEKNLKDEN